MKQKLIILGIFPLLCSCSITQQVSFSLVDFLNQVAVSIFDILVALIGIAIGFLLSERAQNRREKKQAKSVRALISLEIDLNINLLKDFYQGTNQEVEADRTNKKRKLARLFIESPLTIFETIAFESQLSFLGSILDEEEATQVLKFYDRLKQLEAHKRVMILAAQEQREEWNLASKGESFVPMSASIGMSRKFDNSASDYWEVCESIIAKTIAKGNPLRGKIYDSSPTPRKP